MGLIDGKNRWTKLLRDISELETLIMDCCSAPHDQETRWARDLLTCCLQKKREQLRSLIG